MKKVFLFCISFLCLSCSKDYLFKKNEHKISLKIKNIISIDQSTRNNEIDLTYKYKFKTEETVLDSLDNSPEPDKHIDLSKVPSIKSQINNLPTNIKEAYYNDLNEIRKKNIAIDSINTLKTYKIIKKYGYPSFYNRKWSDTINNRVGITFVLTHFDKNSVVSKKLLKLMIKEYFKGRVNIDEMKHYMWHIDGRIGYPYNYNIREDYLKEKLNE